MLLSLISQKQSKYKKQKKSKMIKIVDLEKVYRTEKVETVALNKGNAHRTEQSRNHHHHGQPQRTRHRICSPDSENSRLENGGRRMKDR